MSQDGGTKVFGLFSNGTAQWVRWMVAMALGAGVNYAITQSRLAVLESRVSTAESALTSEVRTLREDVREIRSVMYSIQQQQPQTRIIDGTQTDDHLPKFAP